MLSDFPHEDTMNRHLKDEIKFEDGEMSSGVR